MKFEELSPDIQHIAALALADILKTSIPIKDEAIEYAESVKKAFVALYSPDEVCVHVGDVHMRAGADIKNSVDEVIKTFPSDQLSVFHIVKIVNAVNLIIRNELAPYDNDHTDTDEAARTILKTALAAVDR